MRKHKKKSFFKEILISHIRNNSRDYLILLIVFFIGIIAGVIFINNSTEIQKSEISSYMNTFISSLKENNSIDKISMIKDSVVKNTLLALILWFIGSTVTLIPIIYLVVAFRGFCLGYAISSGIAILGTGKGIIFSILTLLLQNILFIPALLAISLSGIKLYKSIMKDRRRENIKMEIYRHTAFSLILLIVLIVSSFIEVYVSSSLLNLYVKYI